MRSKPNCNQGSGGAAEMYSCHHTNNRRIKADLIVEWRLASNLAQARKQTKRHYLKKWLYPDALGDLDWPY